MSEISVFQKILEVLIDVPASYKLSGIAVVLLFFVFWKLSTNEKLIRLLDKTLNTRLTQSHLFKIIKQALILGFIFSLLLILLAFAAPVVAPYILRLADAKYTENVLSALQKFKEGDLGDARKRYRSALAVAPDDATAEEIRGMITATYYGQGLHREGLEFICNLYKGRAPDDTRYLFNVHAHLRKISKKLGAEAAEKTAREFRDKCGRADFSEFWAYIPFGMMESLRTGTLRTHHDYQLGEADVEGLNRWYDIQLQNSATGTVAFGDYALYFLDRFSELLEKYPKSAIRESVLLDAAFFSFDAETRIGYLERFAADYPGSVYRYEAYATLIDDLNSIQAPEQAFMYAKRLQDMGDSAIDIALQPTYRTITKLVAMSDFKSALAAIITTCAQIQSAGLACTDNQESYAALTEYKRDLTQIVNLTKNPDASCMDVFLSIRNLQWHRGSRAYLEDCILKLPQQSDTYAKALYLLASTSRRVGEYDKSRDYLLRFIHDIENHPLLDDVYAELGYHYLVIDGDWTLAKGYLFDVVTKFPDRNAYDNALWLLAQGFKKDGDLGNATLYYLKVAELSMESRFKPWAQEEKLQIDTLGNVPPLQDIRLAQRRGREDQGLFVTSMSRESLANKLGVEPGDRLALINNQNVASIDDVFGVCNELRPNAQLLFVFLRADTAIIVQGNAKQPLSWKTRNISIKSAEFKPYKELMSEIT